MPYSGTSPRTRCRRPVRRYGRSCRPRSRCPRCPRGLRPAGELPAPTRGRGRMRRASPRRTRRACGACGPRGRGGAGRALPRQHRFPHECAAACATGPCRPPSSSFVPGLSRRLHPSAVTLHADRKSTVRRSRGPCAFPTWEPSGPCAFPPPGPSGPCPHPAPVQPVFAGSPPGGTREPPGGLPAGFPSRSFCVLFAAKTRR